MADGSLLYHRGFGERPTTLSDVTHVPFDGPAVFTAAADSVALLSRSTSCTG